MAADLGAAVDKFLADPAVATAVLGAIQSPDTLARIASASSGGFGAKLFWPRRRSIIRNFRRPKCARRCCSRVMGNEAAWMEERFGPIAFVVKVANTAAALALGTVVRARRADGRPLFDAAGSDRRDDRATLRSQVALSINLTGGVFVNQSAAYSDYHGTGGNPAANAAYADWPSSPTASASCSGGITSRNQAQRHREHGAWKSVSHESKQSGRSFCRGASAANGFDHDQAVARHHPRHRRRRRHGARHCGQIAAQAGCRYCCSTPATGAAAEAKTALEKQWENWSTGRMTAEAAAAAGERLTIVAGARDLAAANVVVEAIVEQLDAKRALFKELDDIVSADCVLATNTSSLSVTRIAAGNSEPGGWPVSISSTRCR